MIFDPLPRYPRGVRFRLCTHTHTYTGGETAAGGWKEEGCRWDRYLDARNRWISGSRTIPGVLQCSGTLKTSRDNGAEWATAAWHAALPRASLSLSLSVCLSIHLSLSLFLLGGTKWKKRTSSLLGEWSFDGKFFRTYTFLTKLRVQGYFQVLEQTHS